LQLTVWLKGEQKNKKQKTKNKNKQKLSNSGVGLTANNVLFIYLFLDNLTNIRKENVRLNQKKAVVDTRHAL